MSFLSNLFGINNSSSDNVEILDKATYAKAISGKKVQLVDVRTADEYRGGHIKNALNIDFFNTRNFVEAFEKLKKDQPVYLYCRSGARSQKAARKLAELGFSQIYDLQGGYMRWK
jgi:rhodanese-related sulfurtransferase